MSKLAVNIIEFTDPPSLSTDERTTAAEFRIAREFLGLTGDWLAGHLGVSARTVRHWEQGKFAIPDSVRLKMEELERRTAEFIGGAVEKLLDLPEPWVITYRSDEEYRFAHPEIPFPAAWHRAVVARIAWDVPALRIDYQDNLP